MKLLVNGKEVHKVRPGSIEIEDSINERSTASFQVGDHSQNFHPIPGEQVEVYDNDGKLIFAGLLQNPQEVKLEGANVNEVTFDAVDYSALADLRIVMETYEDKTAGYMARDIMNKYLAAEGVTAGVIEDGPTIKAAVFPYEDAANSYDDLVEVAGFTWKITKEKKLHFASLDHFQAPFNINENDENRDFWDVEVEWNDKKYRNKQYIRAGEDMTDTQTEKFTGDGNQTTFVVGFAIAKEPQVYVNGVQKTVGIREVSDNKDFYWSKGEKEISQANNATPLSKDDVLMVKYIGSFPIVVVSQDSVAIEKRKERTGTSGIVEEVNQDTSINTAEAALQFAGGKLRKYAEINQTVKYTTSKKGLEAGQQQHLSIPTHNVEGDYLITNVTAHDRAGELVYDVELADGEGVGGWSEFFKYLAKQMTSFSIRENEVLVRLVQESGDWGWNESMTETVNQCPVPSTSLYPSSEVIPC